MLTAATTLYLWSSVRHGLGLVRANERISELAWTDPLTTLANRRAFNDRLNLSFDATGRNGSPFAVLYVDLDHFKDVNDTLGHTIGDTLLKQVAERLETLVRKTDLVARFGGDEFAVLLSDAADASVAQALADRIVETLGTAYTIAGNQVRISASVGLSYYTADISKADAMMIQADLALFRAKEDGRNCARFHTNDLDQMVRERVTIADDLHLALERDELELHYQPQVELASGKIIGLEALVRWNHPRRGLISSAAFIPIAERSGLIVPLGKWVFEQACRQTKLWNDEGIAPQVVAVNVSAVECKRTQIVREIAACLARWKIRPHQMEVEITESVLMEATKNNGDVVDGLRALGLRIAIDDFGTGYSSLSYLTHYPVDRLKIAQELVIGVTGDERNASVVKIAIRLANELGIEVIAEGVETDAQVRFLAGAGCNRAQGFYFSKPVNAMRTTELLRQGCFELAIQGPSRFSRFKLHTS
jgi:diguanylate cyclase (GGDEF)-like protein